MDESGSSANRIIAQEWNLYIRHANHTKVSIEDMDQSQSANATMVTSHRRVLDHTITLLTTNNTNTQARTPTWYSHAP